MARLNHVCAQPTLTIPNFLGLLAPPTVPGAACDASCPAAAGSLAGAGRVQGACESSAAVTAGVRNPLALSQPRRALSRARSDVTDELTRIAVPDAGWAQQAGYDAPLTRALNPAQSQRPPAVAAAAPAAPPVAPVPRPGADSAATDYLTSPAPLIAMQDLPPIRNKEANENGYLNNGPAVGLQPNYRMPESAIELAARLERELADLKNESRAVRDRLEQLQRENRDSENMMQHATDAIQEGREQIGDMRDALTAWKDEMQSLELRLREQRERHLTALAAVEEQLNAAIEKNSCDAK